MRNEKWGMRNANEKWINEIRDIGHFCSWRVSNIISHFSFRTKSVISHSSFLISHLATLSPLRHHAKGPDEIDNGKDNQSTEYPTKYLLSLFFLLLLPGFFFCVHFFVHSNVVLNEKWEMGNEKCKCRNVKCIPVTSNSQLVVIIYLILFFL